MDGPCSCCCFSIFFLLYIRSLLLHQGWKSNWGENLACCASACSTFILSWYIRSSENSTRWYSHLCLTTTTTTLLSIGRSTKCEFQKYVGIDRRMCTLHWCASLLKPIMNFKCTQHLPYTHGAHRLCVDGSTIRMPSFWRPFLSLDPFVFLHNFFNMII